MTKVKKGGEYMANIPEFCIQAMIQCKRTGKTQEELAHDCGVSRQYMNAFLRGREENEKLAEKIRVSFPGIDVPYQYTSPDPIIAGGKEET